MEAVIGDERHRSDPAGQKRGGGEGTDTPAPTAIDAGADRHREWQLGHGDGNALEVPAPVARSGYDPRPTLRKDVRRFRQASPQAIGRAGRAGGR